MKNLHYLILVTFFLISCKPQFQEINFYGFTKQDTLFLYQDGNCNFIVAGMVEQLKSGDVLSAKVLITTSSHSSGRDIFLTRENFYLSDTMNYSMRSGLSQIDSISERFDTSNKYYSFYGNLEVYYSTGDTISYLDTITFIRINPLTNERMSGNLLDNHRTGIWLEYETKRKNQLIRKSYFENGFRVGVDSVFREGDLAIISYWSNGLKNGVCQEFRYDRLYSEISFFNGIPTTHLRYMDSKGNVYDSLDLKSL